TTNLQNIIAIELLAACQGIDFRKPLKTSSSLQQAYDALRARIPFATQDRLLADDIEVTAEVIRTPAVLSLADFLLPSFG
ncbi:MAG: histidine ammonia-lyase, partial [Gammaproteobacteria bacterium]|nr:histidine ammonia-lyase [Gammaproteobacteria bacterium]